MHSSSDRKQLVDYSKTPTTAAVVKPYQTLSQRHSIKVYVLHVPKECLDTFIPGFTALRTVFDHLFSKDTVFVLYTMLCSFSESSRSSFFFLFTFQ